MRSDLIAQVRRPARAVLLIGLVVASLGFSTALAEPEGSFRRLGLMLRPGGSPPNGAVSISALTESLPRANGAAVAAALAQRMANPNFANPGFVSLGAFPGGEIFFSQALDITPGGAVVVGDSLSHLGPPGGSEAFRWTRETGIVGLGYPNPGFSFGSAVSADGNVVVGTQSLEGQLQAYRWSQREGRVPLSGLPVAVQSVGKDVSADGTVVTGYVLRIGFPASQAFRWTAQTGVVGLGQSESTASSISANGSVIVGTLLESLTAFRWTEATGLLPLGNPPNGPQAHTAESVSADGSTVVGGLFGPPFGSNQCEAYRWKEAQGFKVLGLLSNSICTVANAVSANGGVVGGASAVEGNGTIVGQEAFIWTARKGIRRLQDVLVANFGLNLDGWTLASVLGISSDSTSLAMVGGGINPEGEFEAWLAVLPGRQKVAINIKPGDKDDTINPKSRGKITVAILSSRQFDVPDRVDTASLTFGRTGDEDSLAFCNPTPADVNSDGLQDLVCHFYAQSAGFECRDTEGVLKGETVDGRPLEGIEGRDAIDGLRCK